MPLTYRQHEGGSLLEDSRIPLESPQRLSCVLPRYLPDEAARAAALHSDRTSFQLSVVHGTPGTSVQFISYLRFAGLLGSVGGAATCAMLLESSDFCGHVLSTTGCIFAAPC